MSDLPKVYIFAARKYGDTGDVAVMAVTDDGTVLGGHTCSHMGFARHDLHDRGYRHELYERKFGGWGDGEHYQLIVLPEGEIPPADVLARIPKETP